MEHSAPADWSAFVISESTDGAFELRRRQPSLGALTNEARRAFSQSPKAVRLALCSLLNPPEAPDMRWSEFLVSDAAQYARELLRRHSSLATRTAGAGATTEALREFAQSPEAVRAALCHLLRLLGLEIAGGGYRKKVLTIGLIKGVTDIGWGRRVILRVIVGSEELIDVSGREPLRGRYRRRFGGRRRR
eukprot:tig00021728_g23299.t1